MVTRPSWSANNPLATYLPQIQLRSIAARTGLQTEPWEKQCAGSILLVDITGFTEVAEQFAAQGAAAVETLSKVLNTYFGRMAEVLTEHGGDILTFAGDAALALWLAENDEELAQCACRAAQAARAVQAELLDYRAQGITLRQRAAVGVGPLSIMEVGGTDGRWQFLVAGDAITQAGETSPHANSGDVVLSPAAWALVQSRCAGDVLPSGHVKLRDVHQPVPVVPLASSPDHLSVSTLQSYVLPVVVNRLRAGQGAWLAEFRNVTVLFIHLTNPDDGKSNFCSSLHAAVGKMQEVLSRHEGCVYQFLMDDKGVALIGAFGLAPPSHEDDPSRAVRSALAIQGELQRTGMRVSVGISTGRAFCGVVGSETRRQYTAVGTVMNMAARLMQAAAGRVLCDQATFRASQPHPGLSFESLGDIKVKGRSEPLAIYVPMKAEAREESGVVGREAERAVLTRVLESLVQERRGGVIVLEGEPGIGKSRLVEYVLEKARKLNVACLQGAGDAVESSSAYHAWQTVFQTLFRVDPLASAETQALRITTALQPHPDLLQLAPLLSAVLPLSFPDNEVTAQMTGKVRAENTQKLLIQLLTRSASSAAHLLVLEDAHWLDPSSLALTALVTQQTQSLLVVITARPFPDPVPTEVEQIRTAAGSQYLRLDSLALDDALEIARQRLGVNSLPQPVKDLLESRAGGQPFFIQELAYALRDAGLIQIAQGECRVSEGLGDSAEGLERAFGALNIPNTIQGVITSRVDRLPSPQQLTLKVASVIGRSFALFVLQNIYPVAGQSPDIPSHLEDLEKVDLTRRVPSSDPTEEFKHALIQEVVYISVSFANRRELHSAIAEWYEKQHPQDLTPYYPLLAYHWRHAEMIPKAIDYSIKSGAQALENFANQEAIRFLRDALELSEQGKLAGGETDLQLALCRLWLGRAQVNLSNYGDARANLERGLAAVRQPAPRSMVNASRVLLGETLRQFVYRLWPSRFLGKNAGERKMLLEAARAYQGLMEIYYVENAPVPTLVASMKSLNLAESAGPSPELARGYASLGAILGFIPWHSAAAAYCQRALETAEAVNDLSAVSWVLLCKGIYESGLGKWDEAASDFQRMAQISTQLGDARSLSDANQCQIMLHYFRGNFAAAVQEAEELYAFMLKRNDPRLQAEALRWKAYSLLALGKTDALPTCLAELAKLRSAEKSGGLLNLGDVFALRASLHLRVREYPQALESIEEAAARLAKISNTSHELILERATVAGVYLSLWERIQNDDWKSPGEKALTQCRVGAKKACSALRSFTRVFPIGQPMTWLRLGQQRRLAGYHAKSEAAWAQGITFAREIKMPYLEGLIEFEIGRNASGEAIRREHLQRACDLLRDVGAAYDLGLAEAALRETQRRA
ncbi:MAG: adenylate/guanylate cyclase domain-containing protein [Terriglobales bacterium]